MFPGYMVVTLTATYVLPVRAVGGIQIFVMIPWTWKEKVSKHHISEAFTTNIISRISLLWPQDTANPVLEAITLLLPCRLKYWLTLRLSGKIFMIIILLHSVDMMKTSQKGYL